MPQRPIGMRTGVLTLLAVTAAGASLLAPAVSRATIMRRVPLAELAQQADAIVIGRVSATGVRLAIRGQGLEARYVAARVSEPVWGRFERILQPGRYTVSFIREGYQPYVRKDVKVNSGAKTNFTVYLHRIAGR